MRPISSLVLTFSALLVCLNRPCQGQTSDLQILSTASYAPGPIAPDSLVSILGANLALTTAVPDPGQPLPTSLAGSSVAIADRSGNTQPAALLFASSVQVNFLMPAGAVAGPAVVTLTNANGDVFTAPITIATVDPGLFSADGSGTGTAAGQALRLNPDGTSAEQPAAAYDANPGAFVPVGIDVSDSSSQEFLFLYGTGIRNAGSVEVAANGRKLPVLFAGPEGSSPGLDQVNVELPASLAGTQYIDLVVTADGQPSNTVSVSIK